MTKRHLVIATRESPLALQQANLVKDAISALFPHIAITLLGITTQADRRLDVVLSKIGGKGLFVKELEAALLDHRADLAVHSMKDVPMDLPIGLALPVVLQREDPRDVLVSNHYTSLMELPSTAVVGTSSLRRQLQIIKLRPDVTLKPLRGNIHTRLQHLNSGRYDAIVLAAAGLTRMGLQSKITEFFSVEALLPSAGQGALGIECRGDDEATIQLLLSLKHELTQFCVISERAFTRGLGGGCTAPVAAYAEIKGDSLCLHGRVMGKTCIDLLKGQITGSVSQARVLGEQLAQQFIDKGALDILREFQ